jgi:predicted nucleic acid-binding protein
MKFAHSEQVTQCPVTAARRKSPSCQSTRLKEAGTPIGANDLWIACHALAEDASLVTHDIREFQRIVGLRVEDWVSGQA